MKWAQGKWIQFTYIHRLGYECGFYSFIESVEEFQAAVSRYGIAFADVLYFSINGMECKANHVKGWFPDA